MENNLLCEKCGKEVSPFEMPEHLDFHYAQEMELREKEIFASDQLGELPEAPTETNGNYPVEKSQNRTVSLPPRKNRKHFSIENNVRFKLPKYFPDLQGENQTTMENNLLCEKCGKEVSPFKMPEHLYFHYAQEMELRENGG